MGLVLRVRRRTGARIHLTPLPRSSTLSLMHRPFLFRGFKSSHEILESRLGALEREVMDVVWKAGEINVREACELLGASIAYTTVMTTMDRLFKKRLLGRRKVGRAFLYSASVSRQEL